MKSWRNLPPALLAMFAIEALSLIITTALELKHYDGPSAERFELIERGMWLTADVLGAFGTLALARRVTGAAAKGFRIVAAGFVLSLAAQFAWDVIWTVHSTGNFETMSKANQWTWFVVKLVPFVGIAVATMASHRRIAVAAVVIAILADPPAILAPHLWGWLVRGVTSQVLLLEAMRVASLALLAVAAIAIAPEPYPAPSTDAVPGLHAIASGLWLRVIAAVSFAGLLLMLMLGKAGEGAESIFKLATISVVIVNAISFFVVARGALRTLVRDMPTTWMLLGGVANLWCLGVALAQLPPTYEMLYGRFDGSSIRDRAQGLAVIAPLVAIAAVAMIAIAISGFAAKRGLDELRTEAQSKGLGFVTLMVAAIGIQQWLLPEQTSEGSVMFFLVAAAVCSLFATAMMARLCTRAADSLPAETPLPTATLRS